MIRCVATLSGDTSSHCQVTVFFSYALFFSSKEAKEHLCRHSNELPISQLFYGNSVKVNPELIFRQGHH